MGADGDINGVVFLFQLLHGYVRAHGDIADGLEAGFHQALDLMIQRLPGKAIAGDAVPQHAAQLLALLVDGHAMPHKGEVIGGAEAGGTAAHDGDLLAGGRGALRRGDLPLVLHGEALQAADVDGIVHHGPAAAHLAGMLADEAAGGGQGIVLPDELHRVGIAALEDEGDVAGDVHMGGTQGHAGNGLVLDAQAAAMEDMLLIVVPEALDAFQDHAGSFLSDGAVRAGKDALGGLFDQVQGLQFAGAVQHGLHQVFQLSQADPAGGAFPAGLGMADMQEALGQVHGAETRLACLYAPFRIPVKLLHRLLGAVFGHDTQSAHISLLC